ncbi:multidrug efflux MFS transporter [Acidiferrimicrobium sp. IK]|uniref:MDR family MFS transporter n=1 Tax=Acidiferrimicrobium sp. IK TaxID=2871700 RepID=UPI0021CB60CA|nr:MDR family MFS transporter [Acidiferrimicrobium sp. IK]MCU4184469.1 multidrug efflux MFS transporter [Acidiferrimicrobium sp. IK]
MDQRFAVSAVYVAALFLSILDVTIVNVAIPTIGRDFHTPAASVDVVVIGFLVSLAVFIPASGWIGDRFGGKRTLLAAITVFTLASALCGVATSLGELVVFRIIQGVGGGMLTPVGMAMLYRTFPPAERVRLAGLLMIPTALAPALGPVIGGLLVTDLSWRWVFFVNLPIGVAAVIFGALFVTERRESRPGSFDLSGFLLAGAGLGALMYGVSEGPSQGWGSTAVLATVGAGVVLLGVMVRVEMSVEQPMVNLRLLSDRLFRATNVLVVLTMTGFFGVLYLVPLYYQDARGLSALNSGLSTFPEAIGVLIAAQLVSRYLYPAIGPRRLMGAGLLGIAAVTAAMAGASGAHTSLWVLRLLMFALGFCIPFVMMSMQAAAFATISPESTGRASTLFNANRQLGGAVGVALLSTVLAAIGPSRQVGAHLVAHVAAYRWAFLAAAAVALAGSVTALLTVRDAEAASTMVRRRPPPTAARRPEAAPQY